ncbi:MAG: hypothetical protein Q7R41_04905 [Phycisphaerales bacterium]|nr:hypothetical protein [Phycisphaerales bacterium]
MSDIPQATPTAIDYDIACIFCGYNLRGLVPTGRCPECGSNIADSNRGDLLKFADPAWLDKIRFGTSLKLWNILLALLAGLAGAILVLLAGLSAFIPLMGLAAGAVGLWATFLITTQEPRISLHEDPVTLRKVIRTCALAAFIGSIIQQAVTAGRGLAFGQVDKLVAGFGAVLGLAGVVVMFGELVYFRRFALRIPDARLARSTRILLWAMPISIGLVVISAAIATFVGGWALMATPGVSGTGSSKTGIPAMVTTSTAAIRSSASPLTTIAYGAVACVFSVAYLVLVIWYVVLLFRYHAVFRHAAAESRALASVTATAPPVPPLSS